jgi:hypothetical protein
VTIVLSIAAAVFVAAILFVFFSRLLWSHSLRTGASRGFRVTRVSSDREDEGQAHQAGVDDDAPLARKHPDAGQHRAGKAA